MFVVSWSRLKTWRRCHKQYQYKYVEKLARRKPKLPLIRGSILGEMINMHAIKGGRKTPEDVLMKYHRQYRKLFREEKEMYGDIIGECRRIFEGYARAYKDDPLQMVRTEALVTVDLGSDIRFIGYVDKIAKDKRGLLWVLDHKTHKAIPNEDARFQDLQLVFYVWAWNEQYPNEAVSGIIWDYLRTKPPAIPELLKNGELSQRANIDTDYVTYLRAIKDNKLDPDDYADILKQIKRREGGFFRRVQLPHPSTKMIEQIVKEAKDTAIEMRNLGGVLVDRNMTRDCPHDCDMFEICQAELRGLDANFIRKAHYKIKPEAEERRHGEAETESN